MPRHLPLAGAVTGALDGAGAATDAVQRALLDARDGHGGVVLIRGRAGSGLSHVTRQAADAARRLGMTVAHAQGRRAERPLAFGLAAQLFTDPPAPSPAASPAGQPVAARDPAVADGGLAVIRATWARAQCAPCGLAVVVDDLHDADALSLRLLAYGAARLHGWPVALIASLRTGVSTAEPAAVDAIAHGAPSAAPARMDATAVAAIVRRRLPDAPDSLCAACAAAAGDNPRLLDALADDLASRGLPARELDIARIGRLTGPQVDAVVQERLQRLGDPARRLARALAAHAGPVAVTQVAQTAGLSVAATLAELDGLVHASVLADALPLTLVAAAVRAALDGPSSLSERARATLGPIVSAPTPPPPVAPGTATPASLTPSERRVADRAAQGMTTREIAAALFVTPKTVEFHLRNVYRKLEIPSSRSDLAAALGRPVVAPSFPVPRR